MMMIPGRRSHDVERPSSIDGGSRPLNSRLGFLGVGDKSSLSSPRSHSRGDSNTSRDANMSSNNVIPPKLGQHASPSKGSAGRTYDSKLVSREMHRLEIGNLTHLPPIIPPLNPVSSSSLPSTNASTSTFNSSTDNPWGSLHVHVLPLFNGEQLRIPVEDLNTLVKRHIQSVISASPSRALITLEHDASDLISSGMVTLNAKLAGIDDDKLVHRVVEIWGFFWDQVLPYVEGVLLPLHTDPVLSSLYRIPKPRLSDTTHNNKNSLQGPVLSSEIDVRTVAIHAFRDQIILPIFSRLHVCLTTAVSQDTLLEKSGWQQSRLQQMLLVLVSQGRQRHASLSLTAPDPKPSAGEAAAQHLLRAVRLPLSNLSPNISSTSKVAPSFLSGGKPRDRRGRIGQKPGHLKMSSNMSGKRQGFKSGADFLVVVENDGDGDDTRGIRNGGVLGFDFDADREKEREFLDSLRSPDPDAQRGSTGGWGLGNWTEGEKKAKAAEAAEDEDEMDWDWDQAQAVVERMVGMHPPQNGNEPPRQETRKK